MTAITPYISGMHKTTLYLDDGLYRHIQSLARTQGRTQASLIREAVELYAKAPRKMPKSLGMGQSGNADLSDCAEELLEGFGQDE